MLSRQYQNPKKPMDLCLHTLLIQDYLQFHKYKPNIGEPWLPKTNIWQRYLKDPLLQLNKENQRVLKGMKKCGKGWASCPHIKETKNIKINNKNWVINSKLDCNSFNLVYAIICQNQNCKITCIGETKRMLKLCLADHCGYVRNCKTDTATGFHFNSPGHS